jgi:hypothetical protein
VFSNGLSDSARKRVELAVAVSQEKLLSDHVDHALDLVALVNDNVTFSAALSIYTRLMRLDEDEAHNVRTRALAILGKKADEAGTLPDAVRDEADESSSSSGSSSGRSWFGGFTQRLRGRENEELRHRIELIAARTEVALIHTHVDNALHFVSFLREEDELDEQKSVELYLDALDVRESIAEVTYYLALARIADEVLPEHGSGLPAKRAQARRPEQEGPAERVQAVE